LGLPFAMIPRHWAEPSSGLKPRDLHVAIALLSFGGEPDHPAFPSLATLAKLTGLSMSTVQRSIAKMIRLGLIRATKRKGTTTAYTLVKSLGTLVIQGDQGGSQLGDRGASHQRDHRVTPLVSPLTTPLDQEKKKRTFDANQREIRNIISALVSKKAL
jgi:DNA-binding transcriptional MocR family regulator